MNPQRPSIRPPVPPKPKLPIAVSSRDLRDSGISVSEDPTTAPVTVKRAAECEISPTDIPGGVRQLASRFETIALRQSSPKPPELPKVDIPRVRKPSNGLLPQQLQTKIESKSILGSQPAWHHNIDPNELALRTNVPEERIYDAVCQSDSPSERQNGDPESRAEFDEPLYKELNDPTLTDGYSSFESSSDQEEVEKPVDHPTAQNHSSPSPTPEEHLPIATPAPAPATGDHIRKVIDELIEKEQKYIETLELGIQNYIPVMYSQNLPAALRGQRNIIFINLEDILRMHRDHLLLDLRRVANTFSTTRGDRMAGNIAEVFLEYIESDRFYCYVQYAMHHPESEKLQLRYKDYFLKIQHDLNDKLGLNSLLLQPIQRLPRYKLLLNEMVKDALKDGDGKRTMNRLTALLCKVDKRLSILIDRVNQAINVHDIHQCSGSSSTSAPTHNSDLPLTLILQPEGNRDPARDTPINLLYQGKFQRLFLVDIYEATVRWKYTGKLFVFERLLVYAEVFRDRLEYRGHYTDNEVCYLEEGRNRLILYAGARGAQEIVIQSDTNTELQPLLALLQTMTKAVIYESTSGETCASMYVPDSEEEELSTVSGTAESCSTENWDDHRLTTALIEAQQQFLEVLVANRRFYLDTLSVELKGKLTTFIGAFEAIMNLHRMILQELMVPPTSPDTVCRCFDRYLRAEVLDPYFEYVREFRKAMKWIQHRQTASNFHSRVAATVEQFTFLCIEHLQEFSRYFDVLIVKYSEDSSLNIPIDKELFQRLAYVLVRLNSYRANLTLNYDLFLIDERAPNCGLVCFNDRAKVVKPLRDTEAGPCRLFVCERAAICVKVQDIPEHGRQVERFVQVLFLDPFGGRGAPMRMRKSKRRSERLNFHIDGHKFRIDFDGPQNQAKFYTNYINRYTMIY
ncbi:uncharacterized protein LOC128730148 [Anopheles nili]|uniref:uncharacterized protein LOC128730148 n=1 Tax=Anopheles nili TaxID=185578 RepID=UPI00237B90B2|nr:uncharacterized protein LOC128730148 [Anopheles nili]